MSDIFLKKDVINLLRGKYLLILGCSNMRALYRDILWFLNKNSLVPENDLRLKLDFSYLGDRLLKQGELNRGRGYIEMREYKNDDFHIKFNFLTKLYTEEIESIMADIKNDKCGKPDLVLINSCIWDITRWGPDGVDTYKKNMHKVMGLFKSSLPPSTLVIYSTSLPVSASCYGAFLVKQVEFMRHTLRFEIMEANLFAKQVVPTYGYNILDFHYYLRMQIHWRTPDGVHWKPIAMRHMSNILLTHISLCWEIPLPGNFKGKMLDKLESSVQQIRENNANTCLPKFKDSLMGPPKFYKRLKTIPRNVRDDVNTLLGALQSTNDRPKFGAMRNTFCHSRNHNERIEPECYPGKFHHMYQDKENCEWYNERSPIGYPSMNRDMPSNNNECSAPNFFGSRDRYSTGRDYEGSHSNSNECMRSHSYENRDRYNPVRDYEGSHSNNNECKAPNFFASRDRYSPGRYYEGSHSNNNEYMRSHSYERRESPSRDNEGSHFCNNYNSRENISGCDNYSNKCYDSDNERRNLERSDEYHIRSHSYHEKFDISRFYERRIIQSPMRKNINSLWRHRQMPY